MIEFIVKILELLFNHLSVVDTVLLILLFTSWGAFFFVIKTLWKAYIVSQDKRIEDNRKIIIAQKATSVALNQLTETVKMSFSLLATRRD